MVARSLLVVNRWLVLLGALLLGACAGAPKFDTQGVDPGLAPRQAADLGSAAVGRRVQWGGAVVAVDNLERRTRLEVLAYPLDSRGRPQEDAAPRGRFLLLREGYLEPVDYAPGRLITAVGTVTGIEQGQVGEAPYAYPVLEADQLHLWPPAARYRRQNPQFHFGIGVIFD